VKAGIGLANGTPCKLQSLSFARKEEEQDFLEKYRSAAPGEVVSLSQAPYSVNVQPWPDNPDMWSKFESYDMNKHQSKKKDKDKPIIIPITDKNYLPNKPEKPIRLRHDNNQKSAVYAVDTLPIELSFAMTHDKCLGRTLGKTILALEKKSYCPLSFHKLFVAISRNETFDDMRFMTHYGSTCSQALKHLCDIKPKATVIQFLAGYGKGNGTKWDPQKAIEKKTQMEKEAREKKKKETLRKNKAYGKTFTDRNRKRRR
jgi:hypothetical protein